jgi:F420-dependent oxidoreductase-like protein
MQIPARPPTATAMAVATLDVLSGGRFRLGLGLSGPQVSEGWYGVPFTRPVTRTREYVEIVRMALAREPVEYAGREFTLPAEGGLGLGKPLKLLAKPVQERVPIYLGAIGPKAVEQTGALADGWLPFLFNPRKPDVLLEPLRAGLASAGRSIDSLDIAPVVPVAIADTVEQARVQAQPWMAFYLGAMGAPQKNFYVELAARYGFEAEARATQERFLAGDRFGAAEELPAELIDAGCIATTPDGLPDALARYAAAGADTLVAVPSGDREACVRALAKAATMVGAVDG